MDNAIKAPYKCNFIAKILVTISANKLPAILASTSFNISYLPLSMAKNRVLKLKNNKNTANHTKTV